MNVACLKSPTLIKFVEDSKTFDKCVDQQFDMMDTDRNGALSPSDLQVRPGRRVAIQGRDHESLRYPF